MLSQALSEAALQSLYHATTQIPVACGVHLETLSALSGRVLSNHIPIAAPKSYFRQLEFDFYF